MAPKLNLQRVTIFQTHAIVFFVHVCTKSNNCDTSEELHGLETAIFYTLDWRNPARRLVTGAAEARLGHMTRLAVHCGGMENHAYQN